MLVFVECYLEREVQVIIYFICLAHAEPLCSLHYHKRVSSSCLPLFSSYLKALIQGQTYTYSIPMGHFCPAHYDQSNTAYHVSSDMMIQQSTLLD